MTTTTLFHDLRQVLAEQSFDGIAVGIDLGTTKSCIAVARIQDGELVCGCLTLDEPGQPEGQIALPSVVAVKDGAAIVGHAARRLARKPRFHQHRGSFSETKNEIGLRHTYAWAPTGFQSATEIAGHIIGHLFEASGLDIEPVADPLVAEQLKRALCDRLRAQPGPCAGVVEVVSAGDHRIELGDRELFLSDARLDQATFEKLLRPFLDPHPDRNLSDEYVERDSVFRPIHQVLARAGLPPEAVDLVVLAGSSNRIPQVQSALRDYFSAADLVELGDDRDVQGAIARGAALQALAIAATGKPLIAPACSAELGLRTRQGLVTLVKAGAVLPVEADRPVRVYAPASVADRPMDLAVEVIADGVRVVGRSMWQLEAPVAQGEPLEVVWSLDENQCLTLRLRRVQADDGDDSAFEQRFDAPLTHTDQGQVARCRLLEAEELVRCGNVPDAQLGQTFEQMARDAARIGHLERALHYIACAVQREGPTYNLLNLRAIYLEELGDLPRAESVYRQAAEWPTAGFNLALFLHRHKRNQEALEVIDRVLERSPQPAHLVLKGDIAAALGQEAAARLLHQDAISRVVDPTKQSVWSLGWLARCARLLGHTDLAAKFRSLSTAQIEAEEDSVLQGALLPERGDSAIEHGSAA